MITIKEKWEEIIQKLKVEYFLSNISFETWIRPLEVYDIVDDTLYLSINFKASIEHIQNKYLLPLKVCIAEVTGVEYDIKFIPKDVSQSEMETYRPSGETEYKEEIKQKHKKVRTVLNKINHSGNTKGNGNNQGNPSPSHNNIK